MIIEHFSGNPCPFGRPYIIEHGDCHKCDAYQDCNDAVAVCDDDGDEGEELRDTAREMGQGDWVVTSEGPA